MNSFAHYSFGAVGRWMFQYVAGIDTDGPGFRRLILKPHVADGLDWVEARYGSICGDISSRWWYEGDKTWHWRIVVPPNTTATVYVPSPNPQQVKITSGAEVAKFVQREDGYSVLQVPAGTYEFNVLPSDKKD